MRRKENDSIVINKKEWRKLTDFKEKMVGLINSNNTPEILTDFEKDIITMTKEDWDQLTMYKRAQIYKKYLEFKEEYKTDVSERFKKLKYK